MFRSSTETDQRIKQCFGILTDKYKQRALITTAEVQQQGHRGAGVRSQKRLKPPVSGHHWTDFYYKFEC